MSDLTQQRNLFGHPVGLYTLFFAEMWERFSFYGMRALLGLYMIKGFLGYSDGAQYKILGAYMGLVYMMPFFGGMVADRLLGARRCIVLGGLLMAAGHLTMTWQIEWVFYLALALLIVGNGLFKPNISSIVGTLYEKGDGRRDGGFTIFYMGINLGAAMGSAICGFIGETYGWHWGFGLATIGMMLGLASFVMPSALSRILILAGAVIVAILMVGSQLYEPGTESLLVARERDLLQLVLNIFLGIALVGSGAASFVALGRGGVPADRGVPPKSARLAPNTATIVVIVGTLLFVPVAMWLLYTNKTTELVSQEWVQSFSSQGKLYAVIGSVIKQSSTPTGLLLSITGAGALLFLLYEGIRSPKFERERLFVIIILTFFSFFFWAAFEQASSSINQFTDRNVDRVFESRVVTREDLGKTLKLRLNQEQLGVLKMRGGVLNMTELQKYRDAKQTVVEVTIDESHLGMGIEGSEVPTSVFQSVNPVYILLFGLPFSWLWSKLARLKLEPSAPVKFALGLLQLGLGFWVLYYGTTQADERGMVALRWLLLGYLLHTTGELCLSPVGLSMVTKLSPAKLVSTVMGAWFLATAMSTYLAAVIATFTNVEHETGGEQIIPVPTETLALYGTVFQQLAYLVICASVICFCLSPILTKWMHLGAESASETA